MWPGDSSSDSRKGICREVGGELADQPARLIFVRQQLRPMSLLHKVLHRHRGAAAPAIMLIATITGLITHAAIFSVFRVLRLVLVDQLPKMLPGVLIYHLFGHVPRSFRRLRSLFQLEKKKFPHPP